MSDRDVQTAVRISSATAKQIDAVAKKMEAKTPGLKISRSDVMRMAIQQGLGSVAKSVGPLKTAGRRVVKTAKKTVAK